LQILLEVLHLLGSTTRESEDVKGEGDVLLASEVMQGHRVAMGVHEGKIRRQVPDLDDGSGKASFFSVGPHSRLADGGALRASIPKNRMVIPLRMRFALLRFSFA
jgi:hypothetical protein